MTRPDCWKDCTVACEATQECSVCGRRKAPRGRSVPVEAANGYCNHGCDGYEQEPKPGHLWPGEIADMDREECQYCGEIYNAGDLHLCRDNDEMPIAIEHS